MRWPSSRLVWAVATLALVACSKKGDDSVARVAAYKGAVEKDVGSGWQAVKGKDKLKCDSGLRTGADSTAAIAFSAGGEFELQETTDVVLSCGGNPGLSVAVGEVLVQAGPDGSVFDLEIGTVSLASKGRYRIGSGRFDVLVGAATVRRASDPDEVLEPGEALAWEIGAATVQKVKKPEAIDAGVAEATDAGVPDAGPGEDELLIVTVSGRKAERKLPGEKKWKRLKKGEHELAGGTRVRLRKRTKMKLTRGAESATVAGAAEFVVGGAGEPLVTSARGVIDLHATEAPVAIKVPGGVIMARPRKGDGSKARIDIKKGTARVRAQRGLIDVTGKGGVEDTLQIGERLTLARDGTTKVEGRAPASSDFALPSDENATIHAARLPVSLAIRFPGECPSEAVVETSTRANFRSRVTQAKGTGSANISAGRGTLYYRVRCINDGVLQKRASAKGKLRVLRDKATQPLPKRASSSPVDADGRRYRVLYQNRLPAITFHWPKSPKGSSYKFHLTSERGNTKTVSVRGPQHKMRAGSLAEGKYQYYFDVDGKRSKTSTLSIEFDNAAPSTYLRSPRVGERWSGGQVRVQGVALIGSSVKVGDTPVSVDQNGRFASNITVVEGEKSLAVRVSHRKQGVHYYIRRAR